MGARVRLVPMRHLITQVQAVIMAAPTELLVAQLAIRLIRQLSTPEAITVTTVEP